MLSEESAGEVLMDGRLLMWVVDGQWLIVDGRSWMVDGGWWMEVGD